MSENEKNPITIDDLLRASENLTNKIKDFKNSQRVRVLGFTVIERGGYFKAVKSIGGRTVSAYLGKSFNTDIAKSKIEAVLEKMAEKRQCD